MNKKLNKYIAVLDYFDNTFIVLSATSGGISIIYFASIIGAPVGIASASFSLIYFSNYNNNQETIENNNNNNKKKDTIRLLC